MRISVQSDPFDYGAECAGFGPGGRNVGAVVTFLGVVRDESRQPRPDGDRALSGHDRTGDHEP